MYINKEMSLEHITTTAKQFRECVSQRYKKKVPRAADFEPPSLDGQGNTRQAAKGRVASVGCVNPRPSGLINSAIQGLRKRTGLVIDWRIRVAI